MGGPRLYLFVISLFAAVVFACSATAAGGDAGRMGLDGLTTPPPTIDAARTGVRPCRTEVTPGRIKPTTSPRRPGTAIRFGRKSAQPKEAPIRAEGGGLIPIKLPVAVAASTKVTISVPASEQAFTSLIYGQKDYGTDYRAGLQLGVGDLQTTFRGCRGHETWFNGGFLVTEARCVALDVYARGRVERVAVPFGVPACTADE